MKISFYKSMTRFSSNQQLLKIMKNDWIFKLTFWNSLEMKIKCLENFKMIISIE